MRELRSKTEYDIEYAKKHIKRVPLDMQKDAYEELQAASERAGEKINTYIKNAIKQRMEREQGMSTPGDGFGLDTPSTEKQ